MALIKGKKKVKKNIAQGVVHIYTTFNNSIITVTDAHGNALWHGQRAEQRALRVPKRVPRLRLKLLLKKLVAKLKSMD